MNDTNPTNNSGRKSGTENKLVVKDFTRARWAVAPQSIRDARGKTYARALDQEEVLELLELGFGERGAGGHAGNFDMQTGVALFSTASQFAYRSRVAQSTKRASGCFVQRQRPHQESAFA